VPEQRSAVAYGADAAASPRVDLDNEIAGQCFPRRMRVYPICIGQFAGAKSAKPDFSWGSDLWEANARRGGLPGSQPRGADRRLWTPLLLSSRGTAYWRLGDAFAQQDVAEQELELSSKTPRVGFIYGRGRLGTRQQESLRIRSGECRTRNRRPTAPSMRLAAPLGQAGRDPTAVWPSPSALARSVGSRGRTNSPFGGLDGRRADLVAARCKSSASRDIKRPRPIPAQRQP